MENSLTPKEIHELVLEKTKREMPECETHHETVDAEIVESLEDAKLSLKVSGCCDEYNQSFRDTFTRKLITYLSGLGGL